MKISTIKTLFNKTNGAGTKATIAVATVADTSKKTTPKKPTSTTKTTKKVATKKTGITSASVANQPVLKKAATKKTAAVKSVNKKVVAEKSTPARKLVVASDSRSFWISDGQILNSLPALEAAFKDMPVATYKYHALTNGNHFADWVELVLEDSICADALRKAKTVKAAHLVMTKHLVAFK